MQWHGAARVPQIAVSKEEVMLMRIVSSVTLVIVLLGSVFFANAGELPRYHFKALVQDSYSLETKAVQVPFWTKTLPEASNGRITADTTPIEQAGVDDRSMLRLLRLGVFEFATMDISKMAGDDPRFEGCDLAGISLDAKTARKACDAYRGVLDRIMQEKWNAKLLATGLAAPQIFWCKSDIKNLASLKGKKVRSINKNMSDFVKSVGAEPVSINFNEVVSALQRGVVDCGVTGPLSGNTGGWTEVTTHIYPLALGWSIKVTAVNLNTWKRVDANTQQFLLDQFAKFEDTFWEKMETFRADIENCNVGKQPCTLGKVANMKLIPVVDQDRETRKQLVESVVIKNWADRAGGDAAREWNDTVGKVVGMRIPVK